MRGRGEGDSDSDLAPEPEARKMGRCSQLATLRPQCTSSAPVALRAGCRGLTARTSKSRRLPADSDAVTLGSPCPGHHRRVEATPIRRGRLQSSDADPRAGRSGWLRFRLSVGRKVPDSKSLSESVLRSDCRTTRRPGPSPSVCRLNQKAQTKGKVVPVFCPFAPAESIFTGKAARKIFRVDGI